MATFNEITEVVLYPIDRDADPVTFTGASALKAYNGFVNGRPFMATANGTSDPEVWWNSTAYTHMRVTRESTDIDMTDNSCGASGNCDGDFKLTTPQGSFCINASDITGCDEYDEELFPFALLEGAVLTDGDTYTSNLSPSNTYYVGDGILAVHGFAFLKNVGSGVRVYFAFAEGSSCDEKVEQVKNALTQQGVEVSYGGEPGPGPK